MDTENIINKALDDVLLSMERLNHTFENRIACLRQQDHDARELSMLVKGALAMRDSGGIYAAWARHYVEQLDKAEGRLSNNECDSLEEA